MRQQRCPQPAAVEWKPEVDRDTSTMDRTMAEPKKNPKPLTELETLIGRPFTTDEMFEAFDAERGAFVLSPQRAGNGSESR